MSIEFKHPDYQDSSDKWDLVNDICDSENLRSYLISRNPSDISTKNAIRNEQIFKRAVFSAIAGYTSRGFVGQIFSKDPKVTLPTQLEYLLDDCNGSGTSIYQQSQEVAKDIIRIGRGGLLVDMPISEGKEASKADIDNGRIFSTIIKYEASQIINWQTTRYGSKLKLSLVVLDSNEDVISEDGFELTSRQVLIELRLLEDETGHFYAIQKWVRSNDDKGDWVPLGYNIPLDANQQRWNEIPFVFVGSEANTDKIDTVPLYNIAKVNVGHYNNSAIYEDSVFITGQAQPWMSGISQDHINLLNSNNMYVGSGQLLGVPSGERFDISQVQPNSMAREAMRDKIELAIGMGAMFLQPNSAVKTATQSGGEQRVQHSVLSLISVNISEAYLTSLKYVAKFMGADENNIEFELNKDFVDPTADAQTITAMTAKFLQGAIPISDYLKWEQKHGLVDSEKTLEEYSEEINLNTALDE